MPNQSTMPHGIEEKPINALLDDLDSCPIDQKSAKEDEIKTELLRRVKQRGTLLEHIPKEFKTNQICLAALQQDPQAHVFIPPDMFTPEICDISAVNSNIGFVYYVKYGFINLDMISEKVWCKLAMSNMTLSDVPEKFRTDKICRVFVNKNSINIRHVPTQYLSTEMLLDVVRIDGMSLSYIKAAFRTEEVCLAAVQDNAYAIIYVPDECKNEEICLTAVRRKGTLLKHIPKNKQTLNICQAAISQDPAADHNSFNSELLTMIWKTSI